MVNQRLSPLDNRLFGGLVFLSLLVQGPLQVLQQVVKPLLYLPVIPEVYRPGRFPFLTGGLMNPFGTFPVNTGPVCPREESFEFLADGFPFLQVGLFEIGFCLEVGFAGLIGLIGRCFETIPEGSSCRFQSRLFLIGVFHTK